MDSTTATVISALLIGVATVILYKVFRRWLRSFDVPYKQTNSEKISTETSPESDDHSSGEIVNIRKLVRDQKHHRQFHYCDDLLDKTVLDKKVLDNLITKCILMIEDREEIIKQTTQSERNRVLLDILTDRPYSTFDMFIEVLHESDQINYDVQEIVSKIKCTKNNDETYSCHDITFHEHIVQLQKNYKMFVDDGDCRTDIADYLYQNDVLNTEEKEEITNSSLTRQESNRTLCDKFFRKGKDAYRHLIKALRHGKCFELASNMEETKVSEHEIQLCKKGMKKLRERQRKKEGLTCTHDEVIPKDILDCFPEDPFNVECIEGEDAIMTCKIRPGSQPVKWMKDGNAIRQNETCQMYNEDTQYSLKLKNTTTSDSGEYLVQVGQFSKTLNLTIRDCFPEEPSNVECIEGEDAIMTCKVCPGSQPVKWMKAGNEIQQNENCQMYNEDSQYSLQLRNTITSDSGEYCVKVGLLSRKLHLRIIGIPGEITKAERKTYMDAVQSGTEIRKYVRIQVIGKDRVGKTSLVHRLLGYKQHDGKSTDGIAIDRKCLIRESDGEWIAGDVVTERKKNERITAILQGDDMKGKGTKPSNTSLISNAHIFDTKKKLNKNELNKSEEDNLLQKEKQNHKTIPIGDNQNRDETGMEDDETESLKFHEESDETNVTKFNPAAPKNNSEKSNSIVEDRVGSIEENPSISKIPKENQMKNFEQKPDHSILSPQNQNPKNSDEADKLTGETNEKMDKILLRAKNKKEEMTLNGLVESGIWDFAGQKDYYATHQTFFTPHAIYLLVADIEDKITGTDDDGNVNFDTIGDYIDFWFDSIHCFCSDPSAVNELRPHVIMVCTGTDKVPEIEKKKAEYEATFIRLLGSQKKADHRRGIHFISNKVLQKDEIDGLKIHISKLAKEMNYFAEELPTRWINLEIALDVLKDLNETVYSLKGIKKLALAYMIEEKELLLFLNYQHKIGNIIFFEDERDFIILQPNWLVKCFRCLVCDDKKHFVAGLVSEMFKLTIEGELSENLMDELFKKEPDLKFGTYKHHILNVMEKFDIIVKPSISNTSNNSYYMPCMIKNSSPLQTIMKNNFENLYRSPWLVLEFKFLPFAYFNHILFSYIRNYKVCRVTSTNSQEDEHPAIYPEKAVVYLDDTESRLLIICFSKNAISVQIYSVQQPIDSTDNNNIYEIILKTLCKRIAKLQVKLMHNLTYEIKAKCSTGNYKIRAGRMSCEELTKRKIEGKYMCKELDHKFHSSEAIENTWLKYAAVKDVETACVQLEIKIDELVATGIHILSMKEVKELNESSRTFILSADQLVDFLHFQNSLGKIAYVDVPHLRSYVIINPILFEEVKNSFVTDVGFSLKEDTTWKSFKKMSENGFLLRKDLYQIWEQKEFRQILPFKEYALDILIHRDIVYEQRRYDTKAESRLSVKHVFVPSMLTQGNDTDYLTQECTPQRTVSLAFVFEGTTIPPALSNRLICACLSMWTLNQYRGRKLIFSGFVGLSFDREHDIVVCVEGYKILLYLVHKRSKGLIIPDIATSVRDSLFVTLERISEFYQSSIHCKASSKLPFLTEYSCSKLNCFTSEKKLVSETEEFLCKHGENIKNNWRIWNKKKEQKQCDANCQGLSEDALAQIPSNTELLRLSVNCETRMLHDLAFRLGMEEMVWSDMVENYPTNTQMVKFMTLLHLKENDEITFTELDNGLREMEITPHTLCVVRQRKQVKSSIPDDILDCIPSDEIVDRLAPLIGKIVFQLGIELGLSVEDLESIRMTWDRDLTAQNKEVLFAWRKDRTVKPTIRVLEQAFVNIGKGSRCLKEVVKDVDPNRLKAVEIVTDGIRENENRIIQDIQISQILDHMMTHLVISVDDRCRIEQHAEQDDQNKALLDIVIKRTEPTYSVFVDGLRNYGYEDIANDLKCDTQETSPSTTLVSAETEGCRKEAFLEWGTFLNLAIPGIFMISVDWWSFEISVILVGYLGKVQLAAHSIVYQIHSLPYMISLGISSAVCIKVGQNVGAGDPIKAQTSSRVGILFGCLSSLFTSTFYLSMKDIAPKAYTSDSEILHWTSKVMPLLAIFSLFDNTMMVLNGILRGTGHQKYGGIVTVIAHYIIGMPLLIVFVLYTNLKIAGVWWAFSIVIVIMLILYAAKTYSLNWENECKKAQEMTTVNIKNYTLFTKLYESLVQPVLLYGASIWGISEHKQLETVQNKACRYYLGAFKNSSNLAIRGDMGWSTVKTKQNIEVLRLYFKVTNLDGNRLVKKIHESSKSKQRSWNSRVLKFIEQIELSSLINAQNMTIRQKVNIAKDKLNTMDAENWLRDVHNDRNCENGNKLRTFRQFKSYLQASSYVKSVKFRDYRRTLSNFRCGSLPLAIETGRYTKPVTPLNERICQFCDGNTIETEQHFLMNCNFYSDLREELLNSPFLSNYVFIILSVEEKFNYIMSCDEIQFLLAKTLHLMFKRRKINL